MKTIRLLLALILAPNLLSSFIINASKQDEKSNPQKKIITKATLQDRERRIELELARQAYKEKQQADREAYLKEHEDIKKDSHKQQMDLHPETQALKSAAKPTKHKAPSLKTLALKHAIYTEFMASNKNFKETIASIKKEFSAILPNRALEYKVAILLRPSIFKTFMTASSKSLQKTIFDVGGHKRRIISADGRLVASGNEHGKIIIYNLQNKTSTDIESYTSSPSSITFNTQDSLLASTRGNTLKIYNTQTGELITVPSHEDAAIKKTIFSPNGTLVALGLENGAIRTYDTKTKITAGIPGHKSAITSLAFNALGNLLAAAGEEGLIKIYNLETKQLINIAGDESNTQLAFNPQGALLAWGAGIDTVRSYNIQTKKSTPIARHEESFITALAVQEQGVLIASGADDGSIHIYNTHTHESKKIPGHNAAITKLTFDPEGIMIFSGANNGTMHTYNILTQTLTELPGHTTAITHLTMNTLEGIFTSTSFNNAQTLSIPKLSLDKTLFILNITKLQQLQNQEQIMEHATNLLRLEILKKFKPDLGKSLKKTIQSIQYQAQKNLKEANTQIVSAPTFSSYSSNSSNSSSSSK